MSQTPEHMSPYRYVHLTPGTRQHIHYQIRQALQRTRRRNNECITDAVGRVRSALLRARALRRSV